MKNSFSPKLIFAIVAYAFTNAITGLSLAEQTNPSNPFFAHPNDVFQREMEGVETTIPIGDIEGMPGHWKSLADNGIIRWNDELGEWDLVRNVGLSFNGDYMRRGPFGQRTVEWILKLRKRYKEKITPAIGNHDGNFLFFFPFRVQYAAGLDQDYNKWLNENSRSNNLASQIIYFGIAQGISEKIYNFWLEEALKLEPDYRPERLVLTENQIKKFYTNGKINLEALDAIVPENVMAQRAYNFFRPDGNKGYGSWRILEIGKMFRLIKGKNRNGEETLTLITHSGNFSEQNLGVIPGQSDLYVQNDKDSRMANVKLHGKKLKPHNPDHNAYLKAYERDLYSDQREQLLNLRTLISESESLFPIDSSSNDHSSDSRINKVNALMKGFLSIELLNQMDSLWSAKYKSTHYRSESHIYPDPNLVRDGALPSASDQKNLEKLGRAGVHLVAGGHRPVGDVFLPSAPFSKTLKRIIPHIFHDTSYSSVEGNHVVELKSDGSVFAVGRLKDGTVVSAELLSQELKQKWQVLKRFYERKKKENPNFEIPKEDQEKITRLERTALIGKVIGGREIIGFIREQDSLGNWITNYDRYMTVMQDNNVNFTYLELDIWGFYELINPKKGGLKLEEPIYDLAQKLDLEESRKIKMLKDLGKEVLSIEEAKKLISGRRVELISGPADASFLPLLGNDGNKEYVNATLEAWRQKLLSIPLDESLVIMGGGTTGIEQRMMSIAAEVSSWREQQKSRGQKVANWDLIGSIALVTGAGEVDPKVSKFIVLPKTLYWIDYHPNLMEKVILPSRVKVVNANYMGGGGILPRQISEQLKYAEIDSRIKINLIKGITLQPDDSTFKKRSGTDKYIDGIVKKNKKYPSLSIVQTVEGKFKTIWGPVSSLEVSKANGDYNSKFSSENRKSFITRGQSCKTLFVRAQ